MRWATSTTPLSTAIVWWQVPNEMGNQYNDVLSAQDVAVYGGLCALASFDRYELRNHVINNVSFRDYMEINPEVLILTLLFLRVPSPAVM